MRNELKKIRRFGVGDIVNYVTIGIIMLLSIVTTVLFSLRGSEKVVIGSYDYKNRVVDEYESMDSLIGDLKLESYDYTILYLGSKNNLTSCTYTSVVNALAYKYKMRIKAFDLTPYQAFQTESTGGTEKKKNDPTYQKLVDYILELDPNAVMRNYLADDTIEGETIQRFKGYPLYYIIKNDKANDKHEIKGFIRPQDFKNVIVEKDEGGYEVTIDDAHTTKQRYKLREELDRVFKKALDIKEKE